MVEWKTSISKVTDKEVLIRGYDRSDLAQKVTFTDAIYLILRGELPTEPQRKVFDALLVSTIESRIGAPSTVAARMAVSGSDDLVQGVAAGTLAFGRFHAGAIEPLAKLLQESVAAGKSPEDLVKEKLAAKKRIPGYGHAIFKDEDPRTTTLVGIVREQGIASVHLDYALNIQTALAAEGKKLPLNIDGAIAAILMDLGFDYKVANGVFCIARTPGLVAHCAEERNVKGMRHIPPEECEYDGPEKRELP